jgi:serine/threonine protein kinase
MTRIHPHLAAIAGETVLNSSRKFQCNSQLVKSSPCEEVPEIAHDNIRIGRLLGKGGFNNVNEVVLLSKDGTNENRYAIKYLRDSVVKRSDTFEVASSDLVNESKLLQHLQHENIIKLHRGPTLLLARRQDQGVEIR